MIRLLLLSLLVAGCTTPTPSHDGCVCLYGAVDVLLECRMDDVTWTQLPPIGRCP